MCQLEEGLTNGNSTKKIGKLNLFLWCFQHLQEGRKAQQYLDMCWKQMDNVSLGGCPIKPNNIQSVNGTVSPCLLGL